MNPSISNRNHFSNVCSWLLTGLLIAFSGCSDKEEIIDKSPALTTVDVTNIFINSAVSGGNISHDMGDYVTSRGVCWSTSPKPTIDDNKTEDGKGIGNFTSTMSGLKSNTTYYVRAYATNSKGTGYGATHLFTTVQGLIDARDGNIYKTVSIGTQEWMAENLRYLPQVSPPESGSATEPFYYVHDYIGNSIEEAKASSNYPTYGVLYNWPAAMAEAESSDSNPSGVQGVCPAGWHLPSHAEWQQLITHLGGARYAGGKLKEISITHWKNPNTGATNETGFTALPNGTRTIFGKFSSKGFFSMWWTATEFTQGDSWNFFIPYYNAMIIENFDKNNTSAALTIRCVKD